MVRKSLDETYIHMAVELSRRSTCIDKQVGCIITNTRGEILATGYNGAPHGYRHCSDLEYCPKEDDGPDACPAVHAEQNALIQCRTPEQIYTVYSTLSPCIHCVRMLMNTTCKRIVFLQEHKHPEPKKMWKGDWIHYVCK